MFNVKIMNIKQYITYLSEIKSVRGAALTVHNGKINETKLQ